MNTITFKCETVTPMFMAGADGKEPELRAPSIKGVLIPDGSCSIY